MEKSKTDKGPQALFSFMDAHPADVRKAIAQGILLYKEADDYCRYDCCAICDQELDPRDKENDLEHNNYLRTCIHHREYAKFYIVDQIREEKGYHRSIPKEIWRRLKSYLE